MPAKLFRVVLPVPDIDRAAQCYASLLGAPGQRVSPRRHYFDCGGTILALVDPSGHGRDWRPNPDVIYFGVPDLEAIFGRAAEAGFQELDDEMTWGIAQRPWGERSFYAQDPFGNPVCFVDDQTLFTG